MNNLTYNIIAVGLTLSILYGLNLMSRVKTAVRGNAVGALAMAAAIILTLLKDGALTLPVLWIAMAIGSTIGLYLAYRVKMIEMPQMVALLHGLGGGAAAIVALLVLFDSGDTSGFSLFNAGLALVVGTVNLSGSIVAGGKLHQFLPQKPITFPWHSGISNLTILVLLVALLVLPANPHSIMLTMLLLVLGTFFGFWFTIRVGGADMPVTISLLNSLSGVAGASAGLAIGDPLLVAVGGIVGAAGLLLTQIMCRAMNRSLMSILLGKIAIPGQKAGPASDSSAASSPSSLAAYASQGPGPGQRPTQNPGQHHARPEHSGTISQPAGNNREQQKLAHLLTSAKKVIIIPGYGMALAQAQHKVRLLAETLESKGAGVDYAVHPVAGRMPGHMNVLLAEADVDYEKLLEMDEVNPKFADADLVIIIGANDVVNPAAIVAEGTPIYGMPILRADMAKNVIVCNYDTKPGYAGVENPLYQKEGVVMMPGDAAQTVENLIKLLRGR